MQIGYLLISPPIWITSCPGQRKINQLTVLELAMGEELRSQSSTGISVVPQIKLKTVNHRCVMTTTMHRLSLLLRGGEGTYEISTGDSLLLIEKIDEAIAESNRMLDQSILKKRFDMILKPELSARLLLLPKDISHPSTSFLRDQYFLANHKEAQFLSSYDIALQENKTDDPEEWKKFWDMLISRRVFVVDNWVSNVGNIETTYYYNSIKGAENVEFHRGEVDASYHDGDSGSLGTAVLSFLLRKGANIIHAEVFKDVPCASIHAAEAYAALALFFYCSEIGIRNLEFWTDNNDIHGAICGSLTIRGGRKDGELMLLLGRAGTKFDKLISMNKRREQMFLADDFAQSTGVCKAAVILEDYLKKWDYELRGKALFRLSQTPSLNQIMKNLKNKPYTARPQNKYFMEVTHITKLEVIRMLRETLCPGTIFFAVEHQGKPEDFIQQLEVAANRSMISKSLEEDYSLIQFGEQYRGKELLIVIDPTIPAGSYDHMGLFTIILVDPEERALLDPRIKEASALTYVFFNGVLTGKRKGHAGQVTANAVSPKRKT